MSNDFNQQIIEEFRANSGRVGGPFEGARLLLGLHHHHSIEDGMMFPTLRDRRPELATALTGLRAQHRSIARLLDELQASLADDGPVEPAVLLAEVERLTAELEAHLD